MRGYFIRAQGGFWFGDGEGFVAGGGASLLPFANKQHEIVALASFIRVEERFGDLCLPEDHTDFIPGDCSSTDSSFQIGGGIKKPIGGGREIGGEIFYQTGDYGAGVTRFFLLF
jgi:hypothetical protein